MSQPVIELNGIGKRFRLGERERYLALRDILSRSIEAPLQRIRGRKAPQEKRRDLIWALKNISFHVKHGEAIGIIGRNGAGKSTLLKILSRVTEPTAGEGEVLGRVGSLLEVGTGFHPELTGRENLYLSGAILGMTKADINRRFNDIVGFAELERFIDTPVKYYSSGMYIRLAFSVAAHMEPDILLVDEVLAVGDSEFQKRCLGRMGDIASGGRTVLFVSHNMAIIKALTEKTIWLEKGEIKGIGPSSEVVDKYLALSSGKVRRGSVDDHDLDLNRVKGSQYLHDVVIKKVDLKNSSGEICGAFPENADLSIEIYIECIRDINRFNVRVPITTPEGLLVFELVPGMRAVHLCPGVYRTSLDLNLSPLLPGVFQGEIVLETKDLQDRVRPAFEFEVTPSPGKSADMYTLSNYPSGESLLTRTEVGMIRVPC
ncbi:MAG: ATP-binding cassette domain-containing protein, partial [Chloroflexi bacterium]|nr:ATP-binding cassette domain-containing protein [Chloroflexota bacterium]